MTERQHIVLLYSDDQRVRDAMRLAIGGRLRAQVNKPEDTHTPTADLAVSFVEASSYAECVRLVDEHDVAVLVLDGEAAPGGGLGIARQLKDEVPDCPPTCVVIARPADRWLAAYARVDATLVHPLDPITTGRTIAGLLRSRLAGHHSNAALPA